MNQSRSGILHGHLCPCGKGAKHQCAICGRHVCNWHSAGSPAAHDGSNARLVPVCLPTCDAAWWKNPRDAQSAPVETEEARDETKEHARRLLARGGEPDAIAAELGLPVQWVRLAARKAGAP